MEKKKKEAAKPTKPVPAKTAKKNEDMMSPAAQRAMREREDAEMLRKMGERYYQIMPSPEPGEAKPKGLYKGGMSTKGGKVMKEFKAGSLHSGKGGKVVKSPKQAVAIGLSEARRMKKA